MNNYPSIVQEIHNDFCTAADKLLNEANIILDNEAKKDKTKGILLQQIGFKQAQQVKETNESIENEQKALKLASLINYYKQKYPLYKFITENSVDIICNKYKLVQGGLELFKGFVPNKNLKEIQVFKFDSSDKTDETKYLVTNLDIYTDGRRHPDHVKFLKYLKDNNNIISIIDNFKNYTNYDRTSLAAQLEKIGYSRAYCNEIRGCTMTTVNNDNKKMSICAPLKDMDITGKQVKSNKIVEFFKPKINYVDKDPVVLQPVKGGYLIVTAWGDEASDPLVINEINN